MLETEEKKSYFLHRTRSRITNPAVQRNVRVDSDRKTRGMYLHMKRRTEAILSWRAPRRAAPRDTRGNAARTHARTHAHVHGHARTRRAAHRVYNSVSTVTRAGTSSSQWTGQAGRSLLNVLLAAMPGGHIVVAW